VDYHCRTQVGRALHERGVQMTRPTRRKRPGAASGTSAPGKDGCRRLRLRQIRTLEAANQFLREYYVAQFNHRFQVSPKQRGYAFARCRSRAPDPHGFGDFCGG
jgi:hypothetical protein